MSEPKNNSTRRNFLDKTLVVGAGMATGAVAGALYKNNKKDEVVKMITLDGQLVEVDKRYIHKMCAERVSNASLKSWIEKENKTANTL